ncbi:MAG: methyltransferase domain-containing protein [Alphaproteobacteria bacterium]
MTIAARRKSATTLTVDRSAPDVMKDPPAFSRWVLERCDGSYLYHVDLEALTGDRRILRAISLIKPHLADGATLNVGEADYASVYDGLIDVLAIHPEFHFETLDILPGADERPGRGVARLSFEVNRRPQAPETIPANKNRRLSADAFADAVPIMPRGTAEGIVTRALGRWAAPSETKARSIAETLEREFPDGASVKTYWRDMAGTGFTGFFAWGHDHDFGHGVKRSGTMSTRHVEITSETIALGMLPFDLSGLSVLDIGCWTGGDLLVLAGLGATVTAIEEHPVSALAAARLAELSGCGAEVVRTSLYADRPEWRQRFDVIYCSGVLYHVTDPLLFLRTCFAYLKPGGRLVLETKAEAGDGSFCGYAGTLERGWNWYAPSRDALGRMLVDAGFAPDRVRLNWRSIGRLLASAEKDSACALPERAGFSRPGSWLEGDV